MTINDRLLPILPTVMRLFDWKVPHYSAPTPLSPGRDCQKSSRFQMGPKSIDLKIWPRFICEFSHIVNTNRGTIGCRMPGNKQLGYIHYWQPITAPRNSGFCSRGRRSLGRGFAHFGPVL